MIGGLYHEALERFDERFELGSLTNFSIEHAPHEVFDPVAKTWKLLSSQMIQSRYGHAAAAIGDKIFVMGGYGGGDYLNSVEVYDIISDTWEALPPMNSKRHDCSAVAVGDKVYVMGGQTKSGARLNTAEVHDVKTRSWTSIPSMQNKRSGPAAVALGNNIFVMGGSEDSTAEVFSIDKRIWMQLPLMNFKRFYCFASHMNGQIMVLGGAQDGGFTAEMLIPSVSPKGSVDRPKKLLYFDAANYARSFFCVHQRWNLTAAQSKVKKFHDASKRSGWTLVAFFDQAAMTKEAQEKWRKRREREVERGERSVPQGCLRLLGDMLSACGVDVRYSIEADCDDTIAFHAQVDGASILSQDRDFLRYRGATYKLYKQYLVRKGQLILVEQDGERKSDWRELEPPPEYGQCNPFRDCIENKTYLRGSPSPLVALGNLHIQVRPIRTALYAQLGIDSVEEEFPVLVGKDCVWDKKVVHSDITHAGLLLSPSRAVESFEQRRPTGASDDDWIKHQFALRSIVAEICCTATGSTLLETLLPLIETMNVPLTTKKHSKSKQKKLENKTLANSKGQQTKGIKTK